MSFSFYFVLLFIFGAFVTCLISGVVAKRRGTLFLTDFGTVLLTPATFIFVGALRPELHVGFALALGPLIALVLVIYALGLRIGIADRIFSNAALSSRVLFFVAVGVAAIAAATVGPWDE